MDPDVNRKEVQHIQRQWCKNEKLGADMSPGQAFLAVHRSLPGGQAASSFLNKATKKEAVMPVPTKFIRKQKWRNMVNQYFPGSKEYGLVISAEQGNLKEVAHILPQVEDVNGEADPAGWGFSTTALWWATYRGHLDVMDILLKHPDIQMNKKGWSDESTPLMVACSCGQVAAAHMLLDKGADVLIKNKRGATALSNALRSNYDQMSTNGQRRLLVLHLLRRYPPSIIDTALCEVEQIHSGLLTQDDIDMLTQGPTLQELCREVILKHANKKSLSSLCLPIRIKEYLYIGNLSSELRDSPPLPPNASDDSDCEMGLYIQKIKTLRHRLMNFLPHHHLVLLIFLIVAWGLFLWSLRTLR